MSATKEKVSEVLNVNYIVKHPEYVAYEFVTKEKIYVEEVKEEVDLFMLFVHKDTGLLEVMVANDEDFDVAGTATELFDLETIKAVCEAADPLSDLTRDYIAHYELQGEEW